MAEPKKSSDIGMKRGRLIATLSQAKQLDLIAEGLPILMNSAGDLLEASKALGDHDRAATIVEGHALEEIAKILILIDIVRCPSKIRQSRIGSMMRWFYDHLARLIYVDAQSWKPVDVKQLIEYVDSNRKSHFLEGAFGEYILPNWTTWSRESTLYADIITDEDGDPHWNQPISVEPFFSFYASFAWQVCNALQAMGAFSRPGLDIVSSIWGLTDFESDQKWSETEKLTYEMLIAFQDAGLITKDAQDDQVGILYNRWQLPMYRIEFKQIEVPLEVLQAQRDANFLSEIGE